jgi:hypothetical protein
VHITDESGRPVLTATTPAVVDLPAGAGFFRGKDYTVSFSKQGYNPSIQMLPRKLGLAYLLGNLFSWGLAGWFVIDPLTGAMWEYAGEINAQLSRDSTSATTPLYPLATTIPFADAATMATKHDESNAEEQAHNQSVPELEPPPRPFRSSLIVEGLGVGNVTLPQGVRGEALLPAATLVYEGLIADGFGGRFGLTTGGAFGLSAGAVGLVSISEAHRIKLGLGSSFLTGSISNIPTSRAYSWGMIGYRYQPMTAGLTWEVVFTPLWIGSDTQVFSNGRSRTLETSQRFYQWFGVGVGWAF